MYTRGGGSQNVVLLLYDRPLSLRRGIYGVYIGKPYLENINLSIASGEDSLYFG